MTKSQAAFLFSAERLFEESVKVYFWTFTWVKVYPDWFYANCWSKFISALCNLHGGTLRGLKVLELHRDHGVHYHCLVNKRLPVGHVRWLGRRFGIGRVHVRLADSGAADYIANYIQPRERLFSRCPRWGGIGGFRVCRVKDVEMESQFHRRMAIARQMVGRAKLPWAFALEVMNRPFLTDEEYLEGCEAMVARCGLFGKPGAVSFGQGSLGHKELFLQLVRKEVEA